MSRVQVGRCVGSLGVIAMLMLWTGLVLPSRFVPHFGLAVGLTLMTCGVLLPVVAALLDSKWWLLAVAAGLVTFVLFLIGSAS